MNKLPNISESELRIMRVLWGNAPLSAADIDEQLQAETGWHRKTVNTLLSRLVSKEAVGFEPHRSGRRYFPLIAQADYSQAAASQMIDRLFGGRVAPLVAHFVEEQGLSKEDIEELKTILGDLSDE
ncbi:MAG: BlaI/MecI/CopY family transcriptional regulator [Pseudomonadota bacterium]